MRFLRGLLRGQLGRRLGAEESCLDGLILALAPFDCLDEFLGACLSCREFMAFAREEFDLDG